MYNFFVLGLVPGTNIQISFTMWLNGVLAIAMFVLLVMVRRHHLVRNWRISHSWARTIRRQQLA